MQDTYITGSTSCQNCQISQVAGQAFDESIVGDGEITMNENSSENRVTQITNVRLTLYNRRQEYTFDQRIALRKILARRDKLVSIQH